MGRPGGGDGRIQVAGIGVDGDDQRADAGYEVCTAAKEWTGKSASNRRTGEDRPHNIHASFKTGARAPEKYYVFHMRATEVFWTLVEGASRQMVFSERSGWNGLSEAWEAA